jgi:predicted nuclease with TOPRIM domain
VRSDVQARLDLLRKEFEAGQARLRELERQQAQLTETMLRISGAMQVLEELLAEKPESLEASVATDAVPRSL